MKVTIEHYNKKHTVEIGHDDVTLDEVKELIKGLLVSSGFHLDNIKEIFNEEE